MAATSEPRPDRFDPMFFPTPVQDGTESPKQHSLYRFIHGLDGSMCILGEAELIALHDPFARLVVAKQESPQTANRLLELFASTVETPMRQKRRTIYHIDEGGRISPTTEKVRRSFRLVISIDMEHGADIFISTDTDTDSDQAPLELMGWDPSNKCFNFYKRIHKKWVWAGNSYHALQEATRGKGPFHAHVNGGPIMKELHSPWSHWRSQSSGEISLDPSDPFLASALFRGKDVKGAEVLEQEILFAIHRWNSSRLEKTVEADWVKNPEALFRQILTTTNFNLISSPHRSHSLACPDQIILPRTLFANFDAFEALGIMVDECITVNKKLYLDCLTTYQFVLSQGGFKQPGDTHFAFLVPEVAAEDIDLLKQMVEKEIISKRLAACLLMVDFENPIDSKKRSQLLQYIPETFKLGVGGLNLDERFVGNVLQSPKSTQEGTAENDFMRNWRFVDSWVHVFTGRLQQHLSTIKQLTKAEAGYMEIVKVAESRKQRFRESPLSEFPLTLSHPTIRLPSPEPQDKHSCFLL